ncbi:MAG: Sec-independent protein translocase protein TatB [Aestuariivirga sp.]|uniref:Sec-independent protein translocase protein TatB n=1 Tax=Aestuariivirga sp. TaxID=2650926 RepID=UPI0038CF75AE
MFDFGFGYTEMFVVVLVAIIIIGPKDLPRVLRAFGKTVGKMRGMAREFQGHLDTAMKETGFEDVKKELDNIRTAGNIIEPARKPDAPAERKTQEDDFKTLFGVVPPADAPAGPAASSAPPASS